MNKEKWIEIFRAAGLNDEMMKKWHREFEKRYPEEHQSFLEWINISATEIKTIRQTFSS